ncbi:DmsC/YnfH family molybdoenzyme membrane anchor subunit [Bacillus sp. REN3]|uniref:dimethyl sulfoxide reductase anchor subunit family protein n=1 Tax=Bacillus sp. REN3 TaxID=2802440 RepID=UPI001AEE6A0D|nr:DmsC/YnfH family molybdoenzyme membrane anchor subunit [Bacillus sp. REN3]
MHEWPLLIFTVAVPATVGGILFLWFYYTKLAKSKENLGSTMKVPLVTMAAVAIVGLAGSFFHLGTPLNAFNALRGFGRSWMSNEIVLTGVFIALLCIVAGMAIVYKKVSPAMLLVTGFVGLIAIYAMATAYAVTRVNGWDHLNTYVVFYGTAFALGPVLAASLLLKSVNKESMKEIIKYAFIFSVFGIAIQIIGAAMFSAYTPEVELITGVTAAAKLAPYSGMIGFRWVIEMAGLALLGYMALSSRQKINYALIFGALLVFILAEGMSRYVFYVLGS